jgi:hypothetical protein
VYSDCQRPQYEQLLYRSRAISDDKYHLGDNGAEI